MDDRFIKGVFNIAPTPFRADGSLDVESLKSLTEFLIAKRVEGITILGVLGEAHKLVGNERDVVIQTVIETANGRVPIVVGATHAGTEGCIYNCKRAAELGAAAVMVAPPKLARSSNAALLKHYRAVAETVDLPIIVQDHPAFTGIHMSVEFLDQLAREFPKCRFVKAEDDPIPTKISRMLEKNRDLVILGGLGGMMFLEELRHGAHGTMTGFAFPEILVDIYTKWNAGDRDGATETFYKYCPLIRFENQATINLPLRKRIYKMRGAIACDKLRDPSPAVDKETFADLDDLLMRLGLN